MDKIVVAKLHPDATLPARKHGDDAGLDFYALGNYVILPNSVKVVYTGVTVEWPKGIMGLAKPKGSHNHLIGAGVIDAGYQGEIVFKVFNPLMDNIIIRDGEAVAQVVLLPIVIPDLLVEVHIDNIHKDVTDRGMSGGIHNS